MKGLEHPPVIVNQQLINGLRSDDFIQTEAVGDTGKAQTGKFYNRYTLFGFAQQWQQRL
ncbi:hypothetical protein D3C75_1064420 [compost metagenome]